MTNPATRQEKGVEPGVGSTPFLVQINRFAMNALRKFVKA
jgi:hypothetical protein